MRGVVCRAPLAFVCRVRVDFAGSELYWRSASPAVVTTRISRSVVVANEVHAKPSSYNTSC